MSYRPPSRRVLATLAATALAPALLVAGAIPASAASSYCPQAASTRLLTVTDANGYPQFKLWIYQPTPQEVHVCFVVGTFYAAGELSFRTGLTGSLVPTVTPVVDDATCPVWWHVEDPVDVVTRLTLVLGTSSDVCFGAGSNAVRLTVTGASGTANPATELWLDRHTVLGDAWCTYVTPDAYECGGSAIRVL